MNTLERIKKIVALNGHDAINELHSSPLGLSKERVEEHEDKYGNNIIDKESDTSIFKKIFEAFINPFTAILIGLAIVSTFTDIIFADNGEKDATTVIIILTMVFISGLLKYIQETKSGNAAAKLSKMITTTACVKRENTGKEEIPIEDIVVGDIVYLSAGDIIPADLRIIESKDLFIGQSSLTGESEPIEKTNVAIDLEDYDSITEYPNLAFMGSSVISGSAMTLVIATGNETMLGNISKELTNTEVETSFEKGVNSVSWILIRFMLVMAPIVLFINGFTKGDWLDAALFALSIAVGLTPEMLPMIVTTCLAKGSVAMAKEKTIVKNLNSIQNLGAIDVLCTDKTGTLTQDDVILEYPLDIQGNIDMRVLKHAYMNSYFQTGLKNLMDKAIIDRRNEEQEKHPQLQNLDTMYHKVDEIPFDFERRRMSVVVMDPNGKTQMVTKGAVEEMLSISSYVEFKGKVQPLTKELQDYILKQVIDLNEQGLRVIAVSQKTNPSGIDIFSVQDEHEMVLIGYLAFLDPPKPTTAPAIKALKEYGVDVKILTGDNDKVTKSVCQQVGLPITNILLGSDVEKMNVEELKKAVETTNVFAKLSPVQKSNIISILKENGHSVGYMGDGINDAPAMKKADVGISVDTAVDIAKESADVILLEKDLMVLEKGIIEGRKVYANMIKYIKMTASSNFGNMFSVLIASAFLPFLPMMSIQLILLNLIYDLSCTAIPWDNVDEEYLKSPRNWDASSVSKFMIWLGPTSSIFDISTYALMYFVICPMVCGGQLFHQITDPTTQALYISVFQTGWFVESMWTQTLVIHMIRTPKIPFIQSRASFSVTTLTFLGILILTWIPFTDFAYALGLHPLPGIYFLYLFITIIGYMLVATIVKKLYISKYKELL
ncbi:MAG: magnesium-translocating P-type ATPase [Coprobacillaceae bacterium]